MIKAHDLKEVFMDTLRICSSENNMIALTRTMVNNTKIYYSHEYDLSKVLQEKKKGMISVVENSTFQAAHSYSEIGKTAVLNFSNPITPGGGVKLGVMAQEECLCRSSNLYFSLIRPDIMEEYYYFHQKTSDDAFSDRLIYSPQVAVIKSDDELPVRLKESFFIDLMTCAAPYNDDNEISDLNTIFNHRIKAVLESAIKNNATNIVLGAWGCGVFNNPPQLVADEFYKVLVIENYRYAFDNVIFAIIRSAQNYQVFKATFSGLEKH